MIVLWLNSGYSWIHCSLPHRRFIQISEVHDKLHGLDYRLGLYRIATVPEPNASRPTSFKRTCSYSPALKRRPTMRHRSAMRGYRGRDGLSVAQAGPHFDVTRSPPGTTATPRVVRPSGQPFREQACMSHEPDKWCPSHAGSPLEAEAPHTTRLLLFQACLPPTSDRNWYTSTTRNPLAGFG